jgi:hypothetical protein
MSGIVVGKFYICEDFYLFLFPDRRSAVYTPLAAVLTETKAATHAHMQSKELGRHLSYCDPNTIFLVLRHVNNVYEVLAGDKKGWIINRYWLGLKEPNNDHSI